MSIIQFPSKTAKGHCDEKWSSFARKAVELANRNSPAKSPFIEKLERDIRDIKQNN